MKYLTVNIMQEDIDQGQVPCRDIDSIHSYSRGEMCPISYALRRMGYKDAYIVGPYGTVNSKRIRLSPKAAEFVRLADKAFGDDGGFATVDKLAMFAGAKERPQPTKVRLYWEEE